MLRTDARFSMAVVVVLLAGLWGSASAETITLQQGVDGYTGCKDSWLRTWYGNTGTESTYVAPLNQEDNYGAADALDIRYYYSAT